MKKKKIAIFGGGIAGLTVAHECIEAGFEVQLYEKNSFLGGKAQGFRNDRGYAVEHATRLILANYHCFLETMKRVYLNDGKTAFDNIVPLKGIILCYNSKKNLISLEYSATFFKRALSVLKNQRDWGLSWLEVSKIFWMICSYLCKCEERKQNTIWKTSFEDFHQLSKKSVKFREYLETLFNQFIAARLHTTSAVLDDLMVRLFNFTDNPFQMKSLGNVTNAPTNESLIDPWAKQLAKLGVHFHLSSKIERLNIENNEVISATLSDGSTVEADAFVLALPYPATQAIAPVLGLPKQVNREWSMGFQLYLNHIPPVLSQERAFVNLQNTPWKLLYLLQSPLIWPEMEYPPNIKAVLSGVITNIYNPGIIYHKPLFECRPDEIKHELFAQLGLKEYAAVNSFSLDPTLKFLHVSEIEKREDLYKDWAKGPLLENGFRWILENPIYIEKPLELEQEITHKTSIKNLFLAGEYLKTTFHLPTMERANESGKMCAQEIFRFFGKTYPQKRLHRPPLPLGWVRKLDSLFYRLFKS